MATFLLELVTPESILFSGEVQAVRAPGVEGSFGILAKHAPYLTELTTGLIKVTLPDGLEAYIATSGGFLQVSRDKVLVLADTAELSDEIDVERARRAAERLRQMLEVPGSDINVEEIRQALDRAVNRIRVAEMRSTYRRD
jgi:F-type H+-transporting ATPase subunit epsilon